MRPRDSLRLLVYQSETRASKGLGCLYQSETRANEGLG